MYRYILRLTYRMENNKVLISIKKGFMQLIPILIMGALALVVQYFPIPFVRDWMSGFAGGVILWLADTIYNLTYDFMAIYLAISISYYYSKNFNSKNEYLTLLNIILSVVSVLCCLGYGSDGFTYSLLGTTGMFTSFIISIVSTRLFFFIHQKISRLVYSQNGQPEDLDLHHLTCLIAPFFICVLCFLLLNRLLYLLFHISCFNPSFSMFFEAVFHTIGNNLFSTLLLIMCESVLWFFGIHGGNVLNNVKNILFDAFGSDAIISKSFLDVFSLMGGCGTALCLLIALLIAAKFESNRKIAKVSMFTIFFNINEPLVFGLPIVYNPMLLIPFILVPIVSFLIAYTAAVVGFLPSSLETVEWTMPVFFSGYLATGSVAGVIVQFINLVVGTLIYMPFVRLLESANERGKLIYVEEMENACKKAMEKNEEYSFLNQGSTISHSAEAILAKLREDIIFDGIGVFYQPQMNTDGTVFGAEALLRWEYRGKQIFPPLVVHLAQEAGLMDDLTLDIAKRVCADTAEINKDREDKLIISINVSAEQLNDEDFVVRVIEIVEYYGVANYVNLEVTEEISLANMEHISQNIDMLQEVGIGVAMDDFSMGHTSLKYLQKHHFSHVKLDGELVKNMLGNSRTREIMSSIVALGKNLDFKIVAEYVDSEEKKEELIKLGCDYLQGYLYSPAVPKEEFLEFCNKFSTQCK